MHPVFFVKYYDKASTVLGADQIAAALAERGLAARSIYHTELPEVRDASVVFIKRADLLDLLGARRRGCRLVLDVHDTVVFKRRIKFRRLYDGLIFKSRRQLEDFGRGGALARVIHHQWDPRYRPHEAGTGELRIGYLGDPRSLAWWGELPGVECVGDDYFERARRFNAHLSVRQPGREFHYKPATKVSTAAACEAVLLTTADEAAVELLGADYPFYCAPDRDAIVAGMEHLRWAVGGVEWRRALAVLAAVRARTALEVLVGEYVEFLAEVAAG